MYESDAGIRSRPFVWFRFVSLNRVSDIALSIAIAASLARSDTEVTHVIHNNQTNLIMTGAAISSTAAMRADAALAAAAAEDEAEARRKLKRHTQARMHKMANLEAENAKLKQELADAKDAASVSWSLLKLEREGAASAAAVAAARIAQLESECKEMWRLAHLLASREVESD